MNETITWRYISSGRFLHNRTLALWLWFGLSLFSALQAVYKNKINNYLVYKWVFYHVVERVNLYVPYPGQYEDVNLYGPLFSLVIAPFAWMPDKAGVVCWVMANVFFLFYALTRLPVSYNVKTALLLLCSHELMYSSSWLQTNALTCACIVLGFVYVHRQKEGRALFFILAATFIKLYGIVALAFFVFSKKPLRFTGWLVVWSVVLFFAPLLLTSLSFTVQAYHDWYTGLTIKAAKNIRFDSNNFYQDISVMGLIRRIFHYPQLKDAVVIVPAVVLFISQYLQYRYFHDLRFRLYLLASALIFTVIYSTGAESPTYIIALPGICLWYLLQPKTRLTNIFFAFLFILTTFSYSDLFTPWLKNHFIRPYSIKAVPSFITWIVILVQIHKKQFLQAIDPAHNATMPLNMQTANDAAGEKDTDQL